MAGVRGHKEDGSSTVMVYAIVVFLTVVFFSVAGIVMESLGTERRIKESFEIKKRLAEKARKVYELIRTDEEESPGINCVFDEYAPYMPDYDPPQGVTVPDLIEDVVLEDVSSKLPINVLNKDMFEHVNKNLFSSPQTVLANNHTWAEFRDFRYKVFENKLLTNINFSFSEFIEQDVLEEYFTEYSYFNFNVTQDLNLVNLVKLRTGSDTEGATFFRRYKSAYIDPLITYAQNPQLRQPHQMVQTTKDLETWFASQSGIGRSGFEDVFPLINTEPMINIHFVKEEILEVILSESYYYMNKYAGRSARDIVKEILDLRGKLKDGLTPDLITNKLDAGKYPRQELTQYLGPVTWFWKITASEGDSQLVWVITRVPPVKATDEVSFKLIKEEFTR